MKESYNNEGALVSIIMPAYNAEKTIEASINSVTSQTYQNWELLIIEDASTDKTAEIAKSAASKDSRIRFIQNPQNIGVVGSRNVGINSARGKWLAFLDSDDLWRYEKLAKQLKFMAETDAVISYTSTAYMSNSGVVYKYVLHAEREISYKALLCRNIMSCSSVVVKRDAMLPFPSGNIHEDYAVWLKILRNVQYAYGLDEPLLVYRLTDNSKSAKRFTSAQMTYNAYRHVGYGCLPAAFLTLRYAAHSISKRTAIRTSGTK